MPPSAVRQKCTATHLHVCIYGHLHSLRWCLRVSTLQLNDSCLLLLLLSSPCSTASAYPPEEQTLAETRTRWGHSLYLPARPSLLVHSVMQCMNREGVWDTKSFDTVTAAPVAHDKVYTPLLCLISITLPLALGQSACWHLCAAHISQWHVIHSLMLTPGLLATACRSVSIFPISLSLCLSLFLSGWDFSSSEYERNQKWLWPNSVVHGIALFTWIHNLFTFVTVLSFQYISQLIILTI